MFLEQKFYEINAVALEIINIISGIQIGYLSGNKKYPYDDINILISEYLVLYAKYNKKRNKILNSKDVKRHLVIESLNLIDDRQILLMASKKTIVYICTNMNDYIPENDGSVLKISDKLYPIMKELDMDTIVNLYHKFKNYIENSKLLNQDKKILYLQHLFMGYVMYKKEEELTYDDACRYILGDDLMIVCDEVLKKRILV